MTAGFAASPLYVRSRNTVRNDVMCMAAMPCPGCRRGVVKSELYAGLYLQRVLTVASKIFVNFH